MLWVPGCYLVEDRKEHIEFGLTQAKRHAGARSVLLLVHLVKPRRRLKVVVDLCLLDLPECILLDEFPESLEVSVLLHG